LKDGDEVALFPPIAGGSRIRIVHNPWGKRRGMVPGADLRMRLRMLICFGIAILSANFG